MRRRQFVKGASATAVAASMAGCSGILGGGGGGSGPGNAAKTYVKAGVNGNGQALNDSIHPEASANVQMSAGIMSMIENVNVQNVNVVSQNETQATVDLTIEASAGGQSEESTSSYVLRKHDGEWKVYAIGE